MVNKTFLLAPAVGSPRQERHQRNQKLRDGDSGRPGNSVCRRTNRPLDLRGSQDCEQHRQATDVAATQIDAALLRAFRDFRA